MAFIMHMSSRHNLSRTLKIANKLAEVKIFTGQVRHLSRWVHRHPIRIVNEDDSRTKGSNFAKKLKIERESILHQPVKEESELLQVQNEELITEEQFSQNLEKQQTHFTAESCQHVSYKNDTIESENVIDNNEPAKESEDQNKVGLDMKKKTKKERKREKKEEMKMNKLKDSAARAGVPLYTKLAVDDPKFSQLMLTAKSKNKKVRRSHVVLEGKRLIRDAIEAGYMPEQVFFSRVSDAANLGLSDDVQLHKISYKSIQMWSDVSTPPGIMGFLKTPKVETKTPGKDALPLTIICDNIRDPGNLGTILRGAAGVGCQKVILTKGCVDPWEPKVLRSGAGAHFRTPFVADVEWDDLGSHVGDDASLFLADSNALSPSSDKQDETSESEDLSTESSIPVMSYLSIDYPNCGPIVLVIGGETEGLSVDAFKLADEKMGVRLNIPLSNNVDSLNSGIALGVIAFEMKRQFLNKLPNKDKNNAQEIEFEAHGI